MTWQFGLLSFLPSTSAFCVLVIYGVNINRLLFEHEGFLGSAIDVLFYGVSATFVAPRESSCLSHLLSSVAERRCHNQEGGSLWCWPSVDALQHSELELEQRTPNHKFA